MKKYVFSSIIGVLLCLFAAATEVNFYVSKTGDDKNQGSIYKPVATVGR